MPDLNLSLDYFDHPKTRRLIGLLGRGAEVLPIRLWAYCGKHFAKDGRLADHSPQEIETIVEWWGKPGEAVDAMVKVGFIKVDGCGHSVHDWTEHQGHIYAIRQRNKKVATNRWKNIENTEKSDVTVDTSGIPHGIPKCTSGVPQPTNQPTNKPKDKEKRKESVVVPVPGTLPGLGIVKNPRPPLGEQSLGGTSPPVVSPGEVLRLWNSATSGSAMPQAKELNADRAAKVRARIRERSLEQWQAIFERMKTTPFLNGDNDRGWRATFDWIMSNASNASKVIEGKYDHSGGGSGYANAQPKYEIVR